MLTFVPFKSAPGWHVLPSLDMSNGSEYPGVHELVPQRVCAPGKAKFSFVPFKSAPGWHIHSSLDMSQP